MHAHVNLQSTADHIPPAYQISCQLKAVHVERQIQRHQLAAAQTVHQIAPTQYISNILAATSQRKYKHHFNSITATVNNGATK